MDDLLETIIGTVVECAINGLPDISITEIFTSLTSKETAYVKQTVDTIKAELKGPRSSKPIQT